MSYCSHYPLTLINIHFYPRSSVVRTPVFFNYTAPSSLSRDAALCALDSILGSPVCKEKTGGAVWHSCCFRSCRSRSWGPAFRYTMPSVRGLVTRFACCSPMQPGAGHALRLLLAHATGG